MHIYLFKSPKNDVGRKLDKLGQDFKMGINISRWKFCMYFKPDLLYEIQLFKNCLLAF